MAHHLHACHGLNILSAALVSGQQCTALIHVYLPPLHLDSIPHLIEAVDHFPNTSLTSTSTTSRMNGPESSRDHPFWQSKTFRHKKTSKTTQPIAKFTTTPDVNISLAHIKGWWKFPSLWRSIIQWSPADEVVDSTTSSFQLPRASVSTKKNNNHAGSQTLPNSATPATMGNRWRLVSPYDMQTNRPTAHECYGCVE